MSAPSAPSGDHGGLRGAELLDRVLDALEAAYCDCGNWDGHPGDCAFAPAITVISSLRAALAAHPVPEPAQDGEVGEEWRVTGEPGEGYPSYHFVWSGEKAEAEARGFIRLHEDHGTDWTDGPHLHHRTVTRTPWVTP